MEAKDLSCWKCGASLDGVPLPISRMGECLSCRAELHVCLLCEFYDTSVAEDCREPMAQEVKDKTRANFCEYFYPRPGADTQSSGSAAVAASAELDALFGSGSATGDTPGDAETTSVDSPEEKARRDLDSLFGKPGTD